MARSRRALLVSSAAVLSVLAGCEGQLEGSSPASPTESGSGTPEFEDTNGNNCPDQTESFSVDNSRDEAVTVYVTVTRTDGQGNGPTYEKTFELPPHSSQSVGEPVFEDEDAQYRIEAIHGDVTRRETIEGLPCDDRRGRFVTVELGQYSTFKIRIETDGDYPP